MINEILEQIVFNYRNKKGGKFFKQFRKLKFY